eukprot:34625-Eustigmatos_ZCMA.PRE.1
MDADTGDSGGSASALASSTRKMRSSPVAMRVPSQMSTLVDSRLLQKLTRVPLTYSWHEAGT